jgi:hypothetical protein
MTCGMLLSWLTVMVGGCDPQVNRDIPTRYGLSQVIGREIVEQAIVLVDAMLPVDFAIRLKPTWAP